MFGDFAFAGVELAVAGLVGADHDQRAIDILEDALVSMFTRTEGRSKTSRGLVKRASESASIHLGGFLGQQQRVGRPRLRSAMDTADVGADRNAVGEIDHRRQDSPIDRSGRALEDVADRGVAAESV